MTTIQRVCWSAQPYAVVMNWKRISLNRKRFFSKFLKMEGNLHVRGAKNIHGYVTKKVFCLYCRYCHKHNKYLQAANKCDNAFTTSGLDNIKKALEKFLTHGTSASHTEAIMIVSRPTVAQQLSNESAKIMADRRLGLLNQLSAMKFLLRQGIALRGHSEYEGNLPQLLSAWTV